jgi:putative membrane protein
VPASIQAPGIWEWSFDFPLALVFVFAFLYWLGSGRTATPLRTAREQRWRSASYYGGLAVLAIALSSPLDPLSEQLFWAHMAQHVLLLVVAAPLIVLARPWTRLWRALPLAARRSLARGLAVDARTRPLRRVVHWLGRPSISFFLFSAVLLGWHLPVMFDATLSSVVVHALEHTLFLTTAIMFWKQVIPSPPLRAVLSPPHRAAYAAGAMIVSWILAVGLALAPHPLYSLYADEATRPGGISALADQQLAAGIMWVPGSITFVIVIFAYIHRWLAPAQPPVARTSLAGEH